MALAILWKCNDQILQTDLSSGFVCSWRGEAMGVDRTRKKCRKGKMEHLTPPHSLFILYLTPLTWYRNIIEVDLYF